jgi:hypothetical protein
MRKVDSLQFTVKSRGTKSGVEKWQDGDFNTEGTESTEEEGEESVRDGAREAGRWIEAVG